MALTSLGRNAALAQALDPDVLLPRSGGAGAVAPADADAAKKRLSDARDDVRKSLTPWIPGDFLVTYGSLLTAWGDDLAGRFWWMVALAAVLAVGFVWGGAFAVTANKEWTRALSWKLTVQTVVGFGVSVVAAATLPGSGWYDFGWFRDHEAAVLASVGVATGVLVLVLKGLQKRGLLDGPVAE